MRTTGAAVATDGGAVATGGGAVVTDGGAVVIARCWMGWMGAEVTFVVPGRSSAAPARSFAAGTVAMAVATGTGVTGLITMVVPGEGAEGAAAGGSTIVTSEGSCRARPPPRHETTIIVLAATAATLPARTLQNSFCLR